LPLICCSPTLRLKRSPDSDDEVTLLIVYPEWPHGATVYRFAPAASIIQGMARGWESKSVEEQQAAASTKPELKQQFTAEEAIRKRQREAVELSRRGVLQQLQSSSQPRHRQMLELALSDLDAQLARLG
jgi:hypothetical protein